jgi:predicted nucleotidyltransferase
MNHLGSLSLPPAVGELVDALTTMPGAVAVVLGGSRAADSHVEDSDWDLGLYYRGTLDLTPSTLAALFTRPVRGDES